ncbi:hypothetical protein ACFSHQ_09485 [Gemmobacter lanyuensis]
MGVLLLIFAVIWGIGWAMRVPVALRLALMAGFWAVAVSALFVLPEGDARGARGRSAGSAGPWRRFGGGAGLWRLAAAVAAAWCAG